MKEAVLPKQVQMFGAIKRHGFVVGLEDREIGEVLDCRVFNIGTEWLNLKKCVEEYKQDLIARGVV